MRRHGKQRKSADKKININSMLKTAAENDPDMNDLCSDLTDKASGLHGDLMNKSRTARLSDKEGKDLDI